MPCENYREMIQLFVDDMLTDEERDTLKAHVLQCPACAEYLKNMFAVSRALRQLNTDIPDDLHTSVMDALRREKAASFTHTRIPPEKPARPEKRTPPVIRFIRRNPIVAAAAVLVVLVGVLYGGASLKSSLGAKSAAPMHAATEEQATESGMQAYAALTQQPTIAGAAATTLAPSGNTAAKDSLSTTSTSVTTRLTTTAARLTTTAAEASKQTAAGDLSEQLPEIPFSQKFSFCAVLRTDAVPEGLTDWKLYTEDIFNNEAVNIIYVFTDRDAYDALYKKTDIVYEAYYDDPKLFAFLSPDADTGLTIFILPQGA